MFVFGYGSLTERPGTPARLPGHRLTWGVAMDNTRTLPGYKYYLDEAGERPAVHVAFVDIEPARGDVVDGLLLEVDDDALGVLDARERNYRRVEVEVEPGPGDRVWTYVGTDEARRRRREAERLVVSREYVDRLAAGHPEPPCPVVDLRRVDLP